MHILKLLLLTLFIPAAVAGQTAKTGIGTIQPMTTLDVNGAITQRETVVVVNSANTSIPANVSTVRLTGNISGTTNLNTPVVPNAGQRLIVINNASGSFNVVLAGTAIPPGRAMEFIYTNAMYRPIDNGISEDPKWHTAGDDVPAGPVPAFIGTTDAADLSLRTNRNEIMRITAGGKAGIGTGAPTAALTVDGTMQNTGGLAAKTVAATNGGNMVIDSNVTTQQGLHFSTLGAGAQINTGSSISNGLPYKYLRMLAPNGRGINIYEGNLCLIGSTSSIVPSYIPAGTDLYVDGNITVKGNILKINSDVVIDPAYLTRRVKALGKVSQPVYDFPLNNIAGLASKYTTITFPQGTILMLSVEITGGNSIHYIPSYSVSSFLNPAGQVNYTIGVFNKSTSSGSVVVHAIRVR